MTRPLEEFSRRFADEVGRPLRRSIPLSRFSNFRIGGPADYFFRAETLGELGNAVRSAREEKVGYYVIGGGYNVLFDDRGYRGLIIKNQAKGLDLSDRGTVAADSGSNLGDFLDFCVNHGVAGYEFLAGIPGTIGGAVFGNAGAFGESIGEAVDGAVLLNGAGDRITVDKQDLEFGYRHSRLKVRHDLLLSVRFVAQAGDPVSIKARLQKNLDWRRSRHPWNVACAGSYFKNPCPQGGQKKAAAFYLDQAGAKGFRVGGAEVSGTHANFILNTAGATAKNVLDVAAELKRRVWEQFGIRLEEEVIYLPEDAAMA
jgi:UDP-N-acetylmuramate dehydrogenase